MWKFADKTHKTVNRTNASGIIESALADRHQPYLDWLAEGYVTQGEDAVPLSDVKAGKLAELQTGTYGNISRYMPDWRLNRWRAYYQLSKKASLDALEQAEYDAFLDAGETHAQCAVYVPIALQWAIDCINYHKTVEAAIIAATTEAELDLVTIAYPGWPL